MPALPIAQSDMYLGRVYYFLNDDGKVEKTVYTGDDDDIERLEVENCFDKSRDVMLQR